MSRQPQVQPQLRVIATPSATRLETCLEMFALHQEASRHTPRTQEFYRYTLGGFLSFLEGEGIDIPEDIESRHIRKFIVAKQRQGCKDTTVHGYARAIKTFCNFLVVEGFLEDSPMRKVTMPKLEKKIHPPFAREDVEKLLKACQGPLALRDKAIILCLLDSGLRASEFLSLNVGDVDRDGMVKVMGKGQKERFVRLGARARKAMLRYLSDRGPTKPGDVLWMGVRGRLTRGGLQQRLRKLGKLAGVEDCHPHKFRRTFALWSARSGIDAHHLRLLLGHETLEMAKLYLDMVKEDVEEAHKQASPVDRFLSKKRR